MATPRLPSLPDHVSVDRAIRDLQAALPVVINSETRAFIIQSADLLEAQSQTIPKGFDQLWISGERAKTLELGSQPMAFRPIPKHWPGIINPLQAQDDAKRNERRKGEQTHAPSLAEAALKLCKYAELIPALFAMEVPQALLGTITSEQNLISISESAIEAYPHHVTHSLHEISEAMVPLADIGEVRVKSFRPSHGGHEHLAIIVGDIATKEEIPVRLHSSCLTGDVLGSLRCDCGEQLRKAIKAAKEEGAGIVLYLNQEGRGIGIGNKLRAYTLQDQGKDTYDANLLLGYDEDERHYDIAAQMLSTMGIRTIRLMTNNPDKIAQIRAAGIEVTERIAHKIDPNGVNDAYLQAKEKKRGHLG